MQNNGFGGQREEIIINNGGPGAYGPGAYGPAPYGGNVGGGVTVIENGGYGYGRN